MCLTCTQESVEGALSIKAVEHSTWSNGSGSGVLVLDGFSARIFGLGGGGGKSPTGSLGGLKKERGGFGGSFFGK